MTRTPNSRNRSPGVDDVQVGSFFLETLTTGMYENPFHCIREYVQNGFDAIQEAVRSDILPSGEGRILISAGGSKNSPSISIQDNGTGISAAHAVRVLISLGASRKNPLRHAGFRGIGRLAGIAYCTTLRFTTTSKGDAVATIVEFDCGQIRGYFSPGADPVDVRDVVSSSVSTSTSPAGEDEHYTKVELVGLVNLGVEFADFEVLEPYLSEVCPVEYPDGFPFADQIRSFAEGFGDDLPTVHIETKQKRERRPILKPYRINYPAGRRVSKLHSIEPVSSKENGWFGWLGVSNFPGEISDETVAGIRFRSKNIQIDGMSIIQRLAEELTPSGTDRRLMTYAVGEIFITNPHIVPNARRDGFEDSDAWRNVRKEIKKRVAERVKALVRAASSTRSAIKNVKDLHDKLLSQLESGEITAAEKLEMDETIRKQLVELTSPTKFLGADPKEVSQLVASFKELAETLAKVPVEKEPEPSESSAEDDGGEDTEGDTDSESNSNDDEESDDKPSDDDDNAEVDPRLKIIVDVLADYLDRELADKLAKQIIAALDSAQ